MIRGALFDMDGLLFDTEAAAIAVSERVIVELGYSLEMAQTIDGLGVTTAELQNRYLAVFGPDFDWDNYFNTFQKRLDEEMEQNGVPIKPGVLELIAYLQVRGFKLAVASSTDLNAVRHYLTLAGIVDSFDEVVGGDLLTVSKPEPDIFILAAQKLGLSPGECFAFEDSFNGVRSAVAAGCVTVMVPDLLQPTEEIRALPAVVLESLREAPAFIEQYLAGEVGR